MTWQPSDGFVAVSDAELQGARCRPCSRCYFSRMNLLKLATGVALSRAALRKVRRMQRQRRETRRNSIAGTLLTVGVGIAAYSLARRIWLQRQAPATQWPSKKKVARDTRQRTAKRRAQAESQHPPAEVHVERNANQELKAKLGEVAKAKLGEVAKEPRRRS